MNLWNASVRVQYRPLLAKKGQAQPAHPKSSDPGLANNPKTTGSGALTDLISRKHTPKEPLASATDRHDHINTKPDRGAENSQGATTPVAAVSSIDGKQTATASDHETANERGTAKDPVKRRAFTVRLPKSLASHLAKRAFASNETYQDIIQTAVKSHLDRIERDYVEAQIANHHRSCEPVMAQHRKRIHKLFL